MHFVVVARGDLDTGHMVLKAARPGPEHLPVVLLPLLADHPGSYVAHLMRQGGAQPGFIVDHLQRCAATVASIGKSAAFRRTGQH